MRLKPFTSSLFLASTLWVASGQSSLPQVDLGYEIHQAISFNETGQTYNFSNIRYAQPPVGSLRFAAPVPPTGRNPVVQDGSVGVVCPQASPAWEFIAVEFFPAIVSGEAEFFNYTQAELDLQAFLASPAASEPPDPRTTEDCLFLDVIVPKAVFDKARKPWKRHGRWGDWGGPKGAPVLVWIYGGAFTTGSKEDFTNPSGLIKASQAAGGDGIIYVALNYRLGALGWMAGSALREAGGVANAGLYDQRLAIEWVAKHIHLFGGDPDQITVMGQSAGAGSIEHQITAYGGTQPVSFQRAIPQSPGFLMTTSEATEDDAAEGFLALLNVSSIAEARQLPSEAVIEANAIQIGNARYANYIYGPVVDGTFVPALPGVLLSQGAFAKDIEVMVGHNLYEGPLYTPPYVKTNADLSAFLLLNFPDASASVIDYITNVLYPPIYDNPTLAHPYTSPIERTFLLIGEAIFTCNTHYLAKAFNNQTHNYEFQVPPALHGFDVAYTFYNGQGTNLTGDEGVSPLIAPVAEVLQAYITNFVMTGNPNGPGIPIFPIQGLNASMNGLNVTGVMIEPDDTANPRCDWWQQALYT